MLITGFCHVRALVRVIVSDAQSITKRSWPSGGRIRVRDDPGAYKNYKTLRPPSKATATATGTTTLASAY